MQHFGFLSPADLDRLFDQAPRVFERDADPRTLARALGATLYTPGIRDDLARSIVKQAQRGVVSMVLCLEDSVPDHHVEEAEQNLVRALRVHEDSGHGGPLIFIRVRRPEQIEDLAARLGPALQAVTGFVLPKFEAGIGTAYLEASARAAARHGVRLLNMPVLETAGIAHRESRDEVLLALRRLLARHREQVLAVRVGATDLSGLYGLRRPPELTVYDVRVVSDMLTAIVNALGRADDGFIVTGPVWEYFSSGERLFRPRLRQSIFEDHDAVNLRRQLLSRDLDGLLREVQLDKANGLWGKTVIHPSHVLPVHALQVVSHEEYADARDILATSHAGGVAASGYRNKMNESKPHQAWARATMHRAGLFGVSRPEVTFVDILSASLLS